MKIRLTREVKILMIKALKEEIIDTEDFAEILTKVAKQEIRYSDTVGLSTEERAMLFSIGKKIIYKLY